MDIAAMYALASAINGVVPVVIKWAVGATGAVGTVTHGEGLKVSTPVVRNGVGDYSVKFDVGKGALECLWADARAVGAYGSGAGTEAKVISDASASLTAPLVRFQFYAPNGGAAAEVANGDTVYAIFLFRSK